MSIVFLNKKGDCAVKIVALLENTATRSDAKVEHGLSLYVETGVHRILFDMGQTDLFAQNAEAFGIDLSQVDVAVVSHGHYDHGGGLATFLEINDHAPVYVHRDAFLPHYNGVGKFIGLDPTLRLHPRIRLTEDRAEPCEGLTLMTCNAFERTGDLGHFGLTERVGEVFIPDNFRHEQYLLIREEGREGTKRVLLSGCSHKGITDILEWFSPDVLVGGFHVSKMPLAEKLSGVAKQLNAHKTRFYTCHCTGTDQYAFLQARMERLSYLSCGETITI